MSGLGYSECKNKKCGKHFKKKRVKHDYCSPKCRMEQWAAMNPRVKLIEPEPKGVE
jgi:predicted Zn-ribbon and HTH transcriptional regulator